MTELSPPAQVVLNALKEEWWLVELDDNSFETIMAKLATAALRSAADQVVPKDVDPSGDWTDKDEVRYQLLAIAGELEQLK